MTSELLPQFDEATKLLAITTPDGRYRVQTSPLAAHVSEFARFKTLVEVEAKNLVFLCRYGPDHGLGRTLNPREHDYLLSLAPNLTLEQAMRIKKIEDVTRHDVDALTRAFKELLSGTSAEDLVPLVHLPMTSEDDNNVGNALMLKRARDHVMIPAFDGLVNDIVEQAAPHKGSEMLEQTHGQAAAGGTYGHELIVHATRLNNEVRNLENTRLKGKYTGAVGGFNAHMVVAPNLNWLKYSEDFISSFDLEPTLITTQIKPYDDVVTMFQNYQRIMGVITGFDQDMWQYISRGWVIQQAKENETGSSTMAQKVNPIYFERSEGNAHMAKWVFMGMSDKLQVSRLQRDLSDSTVIRCMGLGLGFSLLAGLNAREGLGRTQPNVEVMKDRLDEEWATLSEPLQILMRKEGVVQGYDIAKNLTRGVKLNDAQWKDLVSGLPLSEESRTVLLNLTPSSYIGLAEKLTEIGIEQIIQSRKKTS